MVDELVRRFRLDFPELSVALVLVDPTRRRSGGALLGDRIRMNAIHDPGVFVRSMAAREACAAKKRAKRVVWEAREARRSVQLSYPLRSKGVVLLGARLNGFFQRAQYCIST